MGYVIIRKVITNRDSVSILKKRGYKVYTIRTWLKLLKLKDSCTIPDCSLYKKYGYKTEEEKICLVKHLIHWFKSKDKRYSTKPFSNPSLINTKYPNVNYFRDTEIVNRIINTEINQYIL